MINYGVIAADRSETRSIDSCAWLARHGVGGWHCPRWHLTWTVTSKQSSLNISSPLASGLGKLCLQHEDLVQKYLPVFARELEVGTEVAVRNNVVVIMCDLCVRYTNIVDHYIPNISACLRDNEAVIREQTLIMLTNLLQVGTLLHILLH